MQSKKQIIVNNQSLSTQKSAVSRKKRTKAKDSHRIVDEVEMLDGELKLVRTTKSGQFWSMSFWLREEGKCYRRSLRTRNLDEAKQLAFDKYIQIKADIKLGNRVFTKTAEELVQDFIKHKTDEAKAGLITEGRVQTITISLNRWFLKYVGQNKKLDKITRHDFKEYYSWRRKQAPNVRNATLINERALISSLFKYGISHGFLKFDQTPIFQRLSIKKANVERRDELTLEEWQSMFRSFTRWVKNSKDEKEKEQRIFIKDFLVIAANTGLRFGELRKLKWKMVKTYKANRTGQHIHVEISVPEDTKTGSRTVIGQRGDVFDRIKKHSKFTKPDDWIFVDNKTGEPIHKKVYYKQWPLLMKECGLSESSKNLAYYSLRHTYITMRLIAGTNIFFLAKNVGTSVRMIESHYEHVKTDAMKHELTKSRKRDEATKILLGD
ncbi:MAG: tyrosine-type recombinase/integrase [Alphaproteobacteria bacterium]|jgi:integrase|nr:tyrosine-type recombinase/integrase [Alphaproteobacteria bacterium]